jgi:hypothetical protein
VASSARCKSVGGLVVLVGAWAESVPVNVLVLCVVSCAWSHASGLYDLSVGFVDGGLDVLVALCTVLALPP